MQRYIPHWAIVASELFIVSCGHTQITIIGLTFRSCDSLSELLRSHRETYCGLSRRDFNNWLYEGV